MARKFSVPRRPLSRSCSHDADDNEDGQVRTETTTTTTMATTTTTKTTSRLNGRGKFRESRDTSRAKILPGIHLGPSSRGVSEGSPLVVTACHVGSLKGQRHPEESSSGSSVIRQRVITPLTGRCFRNSPLIRLRAALLSSGAVCKLHMYRLCVWLYKRRGQPCDSLNMAAACAALRNSGPVHCRPAGRPALLRPRLGTPSVSRIMAPATI